MQYSLNGLTIDTEYSLAVYAVNYAGRGPSIEETFSTGMYERLWGLYIGPFKQTWLGLGWGALCTNAQMEY